MEERLNDLKMLLSRDRMERSGNTSSASSSSNIWGSSGNASAGMNRHATGGNATVASAPPSKQRGGSNQKENMFPKRVKVLKDIPIEEPPKAPEQIMAYAKMMDRKPWSESYIPKSAPSDNPSCVHCNKKQVTVICTECDDVYCSMCFAKNHLKGESKKHKSTVYDASKLLSTRSSLNAQGDAGNCFTKDGINFRNVQPSNTVLNGATDEEYFDEKASAASFQEALMEWRNSGNPVIVKTDTGSKDALSKTARKPMQSKAIGADNTLPERSQDDVIAEIKFHNDSSLSYAEKLLLKKSFPGKDQPANRMNSKTPYSGRPKPGVEEPHETAADIQEIRENISRYFSPRDAKEEKRLESAVEITEVGDDEGCENETTLCSVVEPDDAPLSKPCYTVSAAQSRQDVNQKSAQPVPAENNSTPKPEAKTKTSPVKTTVPTVKSARSHNIKPKTPKKASSGTKRQKSNLNSEKETPRPSSSLARGPTLQLSQIARLPKSGTQVATSDKDSYFGLEREVSGTGDHFTRNDYSINTSNLITIRKSKAPWRPNSSRQTEESINKASDALEDTFSAAVEDDFQEFENEILLLENMGRESTRKVSDVELKPRREMSDVNRIFGSKLPLIPLDQASDDENEDEQTLDELEYELASNTGRLNEDGSRKDRITEDLEGILNDLEVSDLDTTLVEDGIEEEQFSINLDAEMNQDDYLSDDEDYPLSVRNL